MEHNEYLPTQQQRAEVASRASLTRASLRHEGRADERGSARPGEVHCCASYAGAASGSGGEPYLPDRETKKKFYREKKDNGGIECYARGRGHRWRGRGRRRLIHAIPLDLSE
jgi:hypothetical protein